MTTILGATKVRERGVITIPKDIRHRLGIHEGDNLLLVIEHNQIVIKKQKIIAEDFHIEE